MACFDTIRAGCYDGLVRTVILGAGAAGMQLARRLIEDGKDVALIERDHDVARIAANALDCLVVQGDGSQPDILARAGLKKARHFVALTPSDELNIVTSSVVAAEYPDTVRVARVRNPYFTKMAPARRSFMGVDRFVNPDIETARAFITFVAQGAGDDLVRFGGEDIVLRSAALPGDSPFAGRSLKESRAALGRDFLAAALERDDVMEVPSGDTVPRAGDTLYLLGAPDDLDELVGEASVASERYRRIVVAGGGPIGRFVAEAFLGTAESGELGLVRSGIFKRRVKRHVVIVERARDVCKQLTADIPGALVLNRDLADEDVFLEEGLEGAELFISATADQELNILAAARAKAFGVDRCLALSENNAYNEFAERLGVDGVLSVKSNLVSSIVEYLRGGALRTLHSFYDRGLKILELTVGADSRLAGAAIRELRLPRGALVVSVNRAGKSSLPAGDTRLAAGDRIGIFTNMDAIKAVEKLFLGEDA